MTQAEREKIKFKYGSKLHSDEKIDQVIKLFYTLKDNRNCVIAEKTGLTKHQVIRILNTYDSNVKKYERQRL